ncbi:hypothetical protein [Agarilytica rhodophyticola]|uniref:hypothetical protein n=1 Tax=Agarilytica rhodophyticola TaxID=1737490 RepID=UPI000B3496F4|nr:hypothetical protein [Agarilytica rhodophyticola]
MQLNNFPSVLISSRHLLAYARQQTQKLNSKYKDSGFQFRVIDIYRMDIEKSEKLLNDTLEFERYKKQYEFAFIASQYASWNKRISYTK